MKTMSMFKQNKKYLGTTELNKLISSNVVETETKKKKILDILHDHINNSF